MEASEPLYKTDLPALIDAQRLHDRIQELGAEIRAASGDHTLTCICVLKGSFIFMADLVRAIDGPVQCEFLGVSSYKGGTKSTGVVQITHDLRSSIEGKHCLIVEDIVDTGLTLSYLAETLKLRRPASLKICTLLDKPAHRKISIKPDFIGFEIPDAFVVGYGLDLAEHYRNLPYVAIYTP